MKKFEKGQRVVVTRPKVLAPGTPGWALENCTQFTGRIDCFTGKWWMVIIDEKYRYHFGGRPHWYCDPAWLEEESGPW